MWNYVKKDLKRYTHFKGDEVKASKLILPFLKYFFISPAFRSLFFYRVANQKFFKTHKSRSFFSIIGSFFGGNYIPPTAKIGSGILMGKPTSIIIHPKCVIGNNVSILHGVVIGGNIYKEKNGQVSPFIGDNVFIGSGAKILGPVTIGENSMIGANAVVIKDIPKNSVAVGVPAKVVKNVDKTFVELSKEFKG